MTYTTLIAEDNPVHAEILEQYLHKYFPEIQIAGCAQRVSELKKLMTQHQPHIAFLDVELSDGRSIDLLNSFDTTQTHIIFVTAHLTFAVDALHANAVDYIIKPVTAASLKKAVGRAIERIALQRAAQAKAVVMELKISIPMDNAYMFIEVAKIMRVEAAGNYTNLILADGTVYLVTRNLLHFEKELPSYLFMRMHDSYLVNRKFVCGLNNTRNGKIIMTDGFSCGITEGLKQKVINFVQGKNLF